MNEIDWDLLRACRVGDAVMVRDLLRSGANVNAREDGEAQEPKEELPALLKMYASGLIGMNSRDEIGGPP